MPDNRALPNDANHTGRSFGDEELEALARVVRSGTLDAVNGSATKAFEKGFAAACGMPFCRATSSGSASVHAAVAAVDPEPGDEFVTTPITDMGAISPILFQTAVPVFADVDPDTLNVTAKTIEPRLTPRTRAIVVTHLFGNPCDMDPILELARARGLPVIEDSAQAFFAEYRGRLTGTMGAVGCFSFQQKKHLSSGEGGCVVTRDEALHRRMRLFVDKAWGYGDPEPDHTFLAPNYRMSELQGAVALAQLGKVMDGVRRRQAAARRLAEGIRGLEGVSAPVTTPGATHVYWKFPVMVSEEAVKGGAEGLAAELKARDVFSVPRYIKKPAFECAVLKHRRTFGKSGFPFTAPSRAGLPALDYDAANFPGTVRGLSRVLVLSLTERHTDEDVDYVAQCLRDGVRRLKR